MSIIKIKILSIDKNIKPDLKIDQIIEVEDNPTGSSGLPDFIAEYSKRHNIAVLNKEDKSILVNGHWIFEFESASSMTKRNCTTYKKI